MKRSIDSSAAPCAALGARAALGLLTGAFALSVWASVPVSAQYEQPPPVVEGPRDYPSQQQYPSQAPYPSQQPYPQQSAPPPQYQQGPRAQQRGGNDGFTINEIVDTGHKFFGTVSRGLASVVEKATSQWGQPNGYILGEEASGAFIGGLRYGEGTLYTKNAGDLRVYWQGPSLGFDAGADGARTMMLVYSLPATNAVFQRFGGVDGSAYFVGGFGMTALTADNIVLVPIRSGLGLRLGANIGYLKFTPQATWNPF